MKSIQHTSNAALKALLDLQPTTPAKVAFAWQVAAGPALARAGSAVWTESGTLRIRARSTSWAREIRIARAMILTRMNYLLGAETVKAFVVENVSPDKESKHHA